jgi:hypothetical protein
MTKKSRLPNHKFAFAKKIAEESQSDRVIASDPGMASPSSIEMVDVRELPKNNALAKVEYTRITTQLIAQNDRKLEYAGLILGKKKQDLINELLADGLDRLNISFPQL